MLNDFKADLNRYRRYGCMKPTWRLYLEHLGLWALLCYRVGRTLEDMKLPPVFRHLVKGLYKLWHLHVQSITGISIPPDCRIGPGLYIGHFGEIFLHPDVVMGRDCNISQGVTIGIAGRDDKRGVPTLGDRVFIAAGAKVFGPVHLADGTVVGANAVVTKDTDENAVIVGIPGQTISHEGSDYFIG